MSKIKLTAPIKEKIIYDLQEFFATEREDRRLISSRFRGRIRYLYIKKETD